MTAQAQQVDADVADRRSELDVLRLEIRTLALRRDEIVANQTRRSRTKSRRRNAERWFYQSQVGFINQICAARAS